MKALRVWPLFHYPVIRAAIPGPCKMWLQFWRVDAVMHSKELTVAEKKSHATIQRVTAFKGSFVFSLVCEPVWPSGKALGW